MKKETKPEYIQRCIKQLIKEGKSKEEAIVQAYSTWKDINNYEQKDFTYIKKITKKI